MTPKGMLWLMSDWQAPRAASTCGARLCNSPASLTDVPLSAKSILEVVLR